MEKASEVAKYFNISFRCQCDTCAKCKYYPGRTYGPMEDCYPDDSECKIDSPYFYAELEDIIDIAELEDGEYEIVCPDYEEARDYLDEPDDNADYYYDMMKDEGLI